MVFLSPINCISEEMKYVGTLSPLILGRFEDAIGEHKHELFLCETVNDVIGIAVAYRKIGECYADLGKFDQALEYENMYLKISQQEGNQEEIQRALATLGRTYLCQVCIYPATNWITISTL